MAKNKKQEKKEDEGVVVITPEIYLDHDDEAFYIEVELPGVDKEHIELSIGAQSLCVEGARDDMLYHACLTLAHPVDETKAKAKFDNGLLSVQIPLKGQLKSKKIEIE